jgi:hypothetical protein
MGALTLRSVSVLSPVTLSYGHFMKMEVLFEFLFVGL